MSDSEGEKAVGNVTFKWGIKKGVGGKKKNIQFYESFTYRGMEYFLYDSVIIYNRSDLETYVGKLVQIYETPSRAKKVKIVWFFRPIEIRNFLNGYKPDVNELFLASGEGEATWRNPQVSEEELTKADYIFYRTFDVAKCKIGDCFPAEIAGVKVKNFFNSKKDQALVNNPKVLEHVRECPGQSSSSSRMGLDVAVGNDVKGGDSGIRLSPLVKELKRAAANVDEPGYHPSDNTAPWPTSPVAKYEIDKSFAEISDEAKVKHCSKYQAPVNHPESKPYMRVGSLSAGTGLNKVARVSPEVKVQHFSNMKKDKEMVTNSNSYVRERTGKLGSSRLGLVKAVGAAVKVGTSGIKESSVVKGKYAVNVHKRGHFLSNDTTHKLKTYVDKGGTWSGSCSQVENRAKAGYYEKNTSPSAFDVPCKKRKLLQDENASKEFDKLGQNRGTKTDSLNLEVAKIPNSPFEKRLQRAHELGTLVSLENLDPSYTSSEVEDLVWHAFHERVEAKMLQRNTFSSPHIGKALVIFKSKDAAVLALSELRRRCLMLADGRPIVGSRATLSEPGRPTRLIGHLIIDKVWQKQRDKVTQLSCHFTLWHSEICICSRAIWSFNLRALLCVQIML
ncbi:Bromo-adjacent domain-containing protein, putative isoform 1 [Melia azedarach]|uniref:Bromo-adjacent domain-containing protein, putative isoform 1 n=1 Tax=Melia azedarach TaxID=155640 RepID=A0ACC1Y3K8_MELAZ|nr:Bromo-adjacent domain-containing protein, putative isoform 1 [Melia azedarach]